MSTSFRGVGSTIGSVMLVILGVAGYLLEPVNVARLLTVFVIFFGARDLVSPPPGRAPSIVVLVIGAWAALTAYGIFSLDFLNSWPLLIVLLGIALVFQSLVAGNGVGQQAEPRP